MQSSQDSLIWRDDTLFGVCEALGQDFGFNPFFLRVAFAVPLLWNPLAAAGAYAAAGAIVLLSRLLSPNPRRAAEPEPIAASPAGLAEIRAEHEPRARDEVDQYLLPIAA